MHINKRFNVENVKNLSQVVRVTEVCDQNGDRVSIYYKGCYICNVGLKRTF